ncbi:DNA polymerase III subunit gamma/tau, partial [Enterococcus hirae]
AAQRPAATQAAAPSRKASPAAAGPAQAKSVDAAPPAASPAVAEDDWRGLVDRMPLRGVVRELAMNCAVRSRDGDNWTLELDTGHQQLL